MFICILFTNRYAEVARQVLLFSTRFSRRKWRICLPIHVSFYNARYKLLIDEAENLPKPMPIYTSFLFDFTFQEVMRICKSSYYFTDAHIYVESIGNIELN
jgi:hypothetical protein